jgi:hypothetical protein
MTSVQQAQGAIADMQKALEAIKALQAVLAVKAAVKAHVAAVAKTLDNIKDSV